MRDDWDRGYEAGKAQGAVDAYSKILLLEQEIERLKPKQKTKKQLVELNESMDEELQYVDQLVFELTGDSSGGVDKLREKFKEIKNRSNKALDDVNNSLSDSFQESLDAIIYINNILTNLK